MNPDSIKEQVSTPAELELYLRDHRAEAKSARVRRMEEADRTLEHARAMLRAAESAHLVLAAASYREYELELEALLDVAQHVAAALAEPSTITVTYRTEVEAPAPRPKALCPDCGKEVQTTATGLRAHNLGDGTRCRPKGGAEVAPAPSPPEEPPVDPPTANPTTAVDAQAAELFPA